MKPPSAAVTNELVITPGVVQGWGYLRARDVTDPANITQLGLYQEG